MRIGTSWSNVKDDGEFEQVLDLVRTVNGLDMKVCATLGMLTPNQAERLAAAGLYAYNHNLDSSEDYYKEVISTRGYQDRLDTIGNARQAGLTVCSGGIIGMGESIDDRLKMLMTLASLRPQSESVPINALVAVEGTPLEDQRLRVTHFHDLREGLYLRRITPVDDGVSPHELVGARASDDGVTVREGHTDVTDRGTALQWERPSGYRQKGEVSSAGSRLIGTDVSDGTGRHTTMIVLRNIFDVVITQGENGQHPPHLFFAQPQVGRPRGLWPPRS